MNGDMPVTSKMAPSRNIAAVSFSAVLLLGIVVCSICNLAISGTFSWSLYPITASVFAWSALIPLVRYGSKGILGSLIILSILMIPFLYVINIIVGNHLILAIGLRMSLYSIAYLWGVYFIFRKLARRKLLATAVSVSMTLPLCIIINISLARTLALSVFDIWDVLSFAIIIMISMALFVIDYFQMHLGRTTARASVAVGTSETAE